MKKNINIAVIGVGSMGKNHARVLSELDGVNLVGVVDAHQATAEKVAQTSRTQAFTDVGTLLTTAKPQAVVICVPTSLHMQVGQQCLEAGCHVLIEKPIATTVEDGLTLQALAEKHKVQLMVGHIERFNPAVMKVKELLMQGDLGQVVSIWARRVGPFPPRIKDVNIAVDLAIHDIDIVNDLMGCNPIEIHADKRRNHLLHREDSVDIFLKYPSANATIQSNWITPIRIRKLNVTCTHGYIEMDYLTQKIQVVKSRFDKFKDEPDDPNSDFLLKFHEPEMMNINVEPRESLRGELAFFIHAINQNIPLSATNAIDALRVALAC